MSGTECTVDDLREAESVLLDGDHVDALRAQMTDPDPFEEAEEFVRALAFRPCLVASFRCARNDGELWPW